MKFPRAKDYPKTVHVKDETYKIRMVKRLRGEHPKTFGLCDSEKKIIHIRSNQSPRGLMRTFIHEVLHAIECEYDIDINHKIIGVLELAFEALMSDNY